MQQVCDGIAFERLLELPGTVKSQVVRVLLPCGVYRETTSVDIVGSRSESRTLNC